MSFQSDFGIRPLDRAEPAKIRKARSYIDEHLEEELSLTKVARFAGLNPNHLSASFKKVTGIKFVDYIARRRFVRACQLLPNRQLRISEIAFEVGFQSLSQFNRVFKKVSGKSPSEYRVARTGQMKPATLEANDSKSGQTLAEEMRSRSSQPSATLRRKGDPHPLGTKRKDA